MLRSLHGRCKLVKTAFGDSGSSIVVNISDARPASLLQQPRQQQQFIINLPSLSVSSSPWTSSISYHIKRMTFAEHKKLIIRDHVPPSSKSSAKIGKLAQLLTSGKHTSTAHLSIKSNLYGGKEAAGDHEQASSSSNNNNNNEFNFDSINVRLLETIIGTAIVVGIDVRSRFNEWIPSKPYQNRRDIQDICLYHKHIVNQNNNANNNTLFASTAIQNDSITTTTPTTTSTFYGRFFDLFNQSPSLAASSTSVDESLATLQYNSSCNFCCSNFDKLLHLYVTRYFNIPFSFSSPILNVLPRKSLSYPTLEYDARSDSGNEDDDDHQALHDDTPMILGDDDCCRLSVLDGATAADRKPETEKPRQRKKPIFDLWDTENETLTTDTWHDDEPIKVRQSRLERPPLDTVDSGIEFELDSNPNDDDKSKNESQAQQSRPQPKQQPQSRQPPQQRQQPPKSLSDGGDDMAAVFRLASIEYADQLNNLVAISLMNGHRPDEAMQCWSSCELSSRAFFNMGVAYESGRHAKRGEPDLDRAHDCYAIAASMDHREAIYNLALFYLYGKGKIAVNRDRGLELLRIASERGVDAATNFCAQLKRQQMLAEIHATLSQRKISPTLDKRSRPFRSLLRQSISMYGPRTPVTGSGAGSSTASSRIKAKQSGGIGAASKKLIKRNHSAPNLLDCNSNNSNCNNNINSNNNGNKSSPIAIASH